MRPSTRSHDDRPVAHQRVTETLMAAMPPGAFWMVDVHESEGMIDVTLNHPVAAIDAALTDLVAGGVVRIVINPDIGLAL